MKRDKQTAHHWSTLLLEVDMRTVLMQPEFIWVHLPKKMKDGSRCFIETSWFRRICTSQ